MRINKQSELRDAMRLALWLRYYEGWTLRQIGTELGRSPQTIGRWCRG